MSMQSIALWPTVLVMTIATVTDLRSRRIPNWLVVPFLTIGVVGSVFLEGWNGLAQSALGILAAAVLMGVVYFLGGMGMGDVKLCAGVGAWVGPRQLLFVLAFMGLAGGVMAFGRAVWGGFLKETISGT